MPKFQLNVGQPEQQATVVPGSAACDDCQQPIQEVSAAEASCGTGSCSGARHVNLNAGSH